MASFHTKTFTKYDDWMTPDSAWDNIKQYIPTDKVIWEAFYGNGASGSHLKDMGFNVTSQTPDIEKIRDAKEKIKNLHERDKLTKLRLEEFIESSEKTVSVSISKSDNSTYNCKDVVDSFIFLTSLLKIEYLQIGLIFYGLIIYWYITKYIMSKILLQQKSRKRDNIKTNS